jgi:phosphoribosyl 1,2-cyclic phosphodiesterase
VKVDVLGCRGSVPVDGAEFARYGGATSSLALGGGERPTLLVDGGTGLRHLGRVTDEPFEGALLLSHLHWDHIQGIPFCPILDHPDARVDVYVPSQGTPGRALISRLMSPPTFPISPDGLLGRWTFHDLEPGHIELGPFDVEVGEIPHKGGRTYAFRITDEERSLAYMSDHAPGPPGSGPAGLGEIDPRLVGMLEGADLLFHDGQYRDEEYAARAHFGHSAIGYAIELARTASVGRLLLFHHDPSRTDDELDLVSRWLPDRVGVARQGTSL